jgi:hypothetical protein
MKSYILAWGVFIGGVLLGGLITGIFASMKIRGLQDVIKLKDSMIYRLQEVIRRDGNG